MYGTVNGAAVNGSYNKRSQVMTCQYQCHWNVLTIYSFFHEIVRSGHLIWMIKHSEEHNLVNHIQSTKYLYIVIYIYIGPYKPHTDVKTLPRMTGQYRLSSSSCFSSWCCRSTMYLRALYKEAWNMLTNITTCVSFNSSITGMSIEGWVIKNV